MDIHEYEPLWGFWIVQDLIGQGSFGRVYHCTRTEFNETFDAAVKIIQIPMVPEEIAHARDEGLDDDSIREYFKGIAEDLLREITLMDRLKGLSNVVSIGDHLLKQHSDGIGWDILIRMEYLTSLPLYVRSHRMTPLDVIQLGMHISRAIEQCQRVNIVHRDIKPDNIFVSEHGDYKLGDFGIARQMERTQMSMSQKGTVAYMAPEVYGGRHYDLRADLYSLGLVMYRLLNHNRLPFLPAYPAPISHTERENSITCRMRGDAIPPPALGCVELADIVLKACAFDPARRHVTPRELHDELERLASDMRQPLSNLDGTIDPPPVYVPRQVTTVRTFHTIMQDSLLTGDGLPSPTLAPETGSWTAVDEAGGNHTSVSTVQYQAVAEVVPEGNGDRAAVHLSRKQDSDHDAPRNEPVVAVSQSDRKKTIKRKKPDGTLSASRRGARRHRLVAVLAAAVVLWCLACILIFVPGLRPVENVELPDFIGQHYEDVLGSSEYAFSFDVIEGYAIGEQPGTIYDQVPVAHEQVPPDSAVTLYVNLQRRQLVLPDVTGMKSSQAMQLLDSLDVVVDRQYMTDPEFPFDTVIRSSPEAGTTVYTGDLVTLLVSDHLDATDVKDKIVVPDVVGMAYSAAQGALGRNMLKEGTKTYEASTKPRDTVIKQGIAAGTRVDAGTGVDLTLSAGDSKVTVPDLVGKPYSEAQGELKKRNLTEGTPTWEVSTQKKDTVLRQSVAAGTSVSLGTVVSLVLSAGETTVRVPHLIGMTYTAAKSELARLGLIEGNTSWSNSSIYPKDTIMQQGKASGTMVSPGTSIDLVISSGPASTTIDMPHLIGKSLSDAQSILAANSLELKGIYQLEPGVVTWQSVDGGQKVSTGTQIWLGVGNTVVPDLIGDMIGQATDAYLASIYLYGDLSFRNTLTTYGTILETDPVAGTPVPIWTRITLVYSSGWVSPRRSLYPSAPPTAFQGAASTEKNHGAHIHAHSASMPTCTIAFDYRPAAVPSLRPRRHGMYSR